MNTRTPMMAWPTRNTKAPRRRSSSIQVSSRSRTVRSRQQSSTKMIAQSQQEGIAAPGDASAAMADNVACPPW